MLLKSSRKKSTTNNLCPHKGKTKLNQTTLRAWKDTKK